MSSLKIRNLSLKNWIIVVSSFISIICFFLTWHRAIFIDGEVWTSDSGLTFALAGASTSGIPLQSIYATLGAAVISLFLCMMYLRQGRETKKIIPLTQVILGFMGLVPFVLLMLAVRYVARRSPSGIVMHWFSYFFFIAILAMIGILVGAILSYIEILRHSNSLVFQKIKKLSLSNWIIVIASLIAIFCYFFPWVTTYLMVEGKAIKAVSESGLEIALARAVRWIRIPWPLPFVILIAATLSLFLCVSYSIKVYHLKRVLPIAQIFLSSVGLLLFNLIIFVRWWPRGSMLIVFSNFFFIAIFATIGILVGAILSYIEILRHSSSRVYPPINVPLGK